MGYETPKVAKFQSNLLFSLDLVLKIGIVCYGVFYAVVHSTIMAWRDACADTGTTPKRVGTRVSDSTHCHELLLIGLVGREQSSAGRTFQCDPGF